jgi:hypothetical protein
MMPEAREKKQSSTTGVRLRARHVDSNEEVDSTYPMALGDEF